MRCHKPVSTLPTHHQPSARSGDAFSGKSFWLSYDQGTWYLGNWAPNVYKAAPETDLLSLCAEFVDVGSDAQTEVPAGLVEQFRLTKLSAEEADEVIEC